MLTANPTPLAVSPGTICLTFDDGPGRHTLDIARLLAHHEIRATFFVVGRRAERSIEVVREVRELGHWIGNHTFHHHPLAARPGWEDAVGEVVGKNRSCLICRPDWRRSVIAAATLRQLVGRRRRGTQSVRRWAKVRRAHRLGHRCADQAIGGGVRNGQPWDTRKKCQTAYLHAIESRGGRRRACCMTVRAAA